MLLRILIWSFVLVMVFRFIARFVLPVFKITKAAHDGLRKMQSQMEEMQQQKPPTPQNNRVVKEGDYIDYEEIK